MSNKDEFTEWQRRTPNQQGNYFDENRIEQMNNKLSFDIPQKLNEVDKTDKYSNLLEIENIEELKKIKKRFSKNNGDLYEWDRNEQGHGGCSASIFRYISFLESRDRPPIEPKDSSTFNIKNIILYGSPGVGKTHSYQKLISMIEDKKDQKEIFDTIKNSSLIEQNNEIYQKVKDEKRVEFVTFHQSYSYEDFIEGFRPKKDGSIKLEDGIFKKLCQEAGKNKDQNYYIIIDEINRGNISKIFGELITLIEEDKRNRLEVTLPYSKEPFKIPSNLYIIATMNTTDKSIATIDIALRRRFTFIKMSPNPKLVNNSHAQALMIELNDYIKQNLGEDYMLGHSYFMKVQSDEELEFVKEYKLKPLLEEYFYADDKKLDEVLKLLGLDND